jgi:hypothetical protein
MRTSAFRLAICSVVTTLLALSGTQAWAQRARTRTETIRINFPISSPAPRPACASTGYAAICPSDPTGANCGCYNVSTGIARGNMVGNGSAVIAFTVDPGSATASSTSTTANCLPVFGTITTTTQTRRGRNQPFVTNVININGSLCLSLSKRGAGSLNGGFGIATSGNNLSGYGTVTGDINPNGLMVLKLSGPVS